MEKDSGFAEFNAVLILFFITALIAGSVLFASSAINYSKADKRDFDEKQSAVLLLDEIIEKMQDLKYFSYDDKNNALLHSLKAEYGNYNLDFTDVSSGFNLNFISDSDLSDTNISRLLFLDNSGSAFSGWRNSNGLTTEKDEWKPYIKEETLQYCVSYGWLHKDDFDSFGFKYIAREFSTSNIEELFPLVSNFPRMNVNMINPEILRSFVTRSSFRIERSSEKAAALINSLKQRSLSHSEIADIMRVTVNHPLMGYLGTKTAFWKLEFTKSPTLKVQAIAAAIPIKNGTVQDIERYVLLERRFIE